MTTKTHGSQKDSDSQESDDIPQSDAAQKERFDGKEDGAEDLGKKDDA